MEYLGIKNKETDTVGNTRVWVEVVKDELVMFKFDHNPTVTEVKNTTNTYINNLISLQNATTEE